MLFVEDDPERGWNELAPSFLRESQEYASWRREGVPRPGEVEQVPVAGQTPVSGGGHVTGELVRLFVDWDIVVDSLVMVVHSHR